MPTNPRSVVALFSVALVAALAGDARAGPYDYLGGEGIFGPVFGPTPAKTTPQPGQQQTILAGFQAICGVATSTIDAAFYQITSPDEVSALVTAAKAGITVRVVTDASYAQNAAQVSTLRAGGITVVERPATTSAIMHDKYMVVDAAAVWTGSANMTTGSSEYNVESDVFIVSPDLAADYEWDFNQMFAGNFGPAKSGAPPFPTVSVPSANGGMTSIDVHFSAEDAANEFNALANIVSSATSSIQFLAYEFKESQASAPLYTAIKTAYASGIPVQGIFDDSQQAQVTLNSSTLADFQQAGMQVISWCPANPSGFTHAKVFIIDGTTVELGSFNYTEQAEQQNDENFIVVHADTYVGAKYQQEFQYVWETLAGQTGAIMTQAASSGGSGSTGSGGSSGGSSSGGSSSGGSSSGGSGSNINVGGLSGGSSSQSSSSSSLTKGGGSGGGCAIGAEGAEDGAALTWLLAVGAVVGLGLAGRARRA